MNPIAFLFSVLGANVFWACYAALTLVMSALMMKKFMLVTYTYLTKGEEAAERLGQTSSYDNFDKPISMLFVPIMLITWPFWFAGLVLWYSFYAFFHGLAFVTGGAFKLIDKLTPSVDIKVKGRS